MDNFTKKINAKMKLYREGMETRNPVKGVTSNPIQAASPTTQSPQSNQISTSPTANTAQNQPEDKNVQSQSENSTYNPQDMEKFVTYLGDNVNNPNAINQFLDLVAKNPKLAGLLQR